MWLVLLTKDTCLLLEVNYWAVRAKRTKERYQTFSPENTFVWLSEVLSLMRVGVLWDGALSPCRRSDKYGHSSINTFTGALFASCHTGETAKDVCCHILAAFAVLGIPQQIKTDNGPAYTSQQFPSFSTLWGISHITGTPTGQAVI